MEREIQLTMRNAINMKKILRSTYLDGISNYIKAHGQPYGEHNDLFIDVEQDLNIDLVKQPDNGGLVRYANLKEDGKVTLTTEGGEEYEPKLSNEDIYVLGTIFTKMC